MPLKNNLDGYRLGNPVPETPYRVPKGQATQGNPVPHTTFNREALAQIDKRAEQRRIGHSRKGELQEGASQ